MTIVFGTPNISRHSRDPSRTSAALTSPPRYSFVGTSVGVTSPLEPEKSVGRGNEGREDGEDGGGRHLPMDSGGEKVLVPPRIHRKMSSSTVLTVFAALVASANGLLWLQWGGDANARAYE
ncbi:unnamed protein product [Caenorhabditis auriculariae]|uniref:Uncharacterized protein n=1 Tax=Caenorhabditis auriculariae TaxID=2777116 RepID=A0A8S1HH49_9PELO|nr:unnamed protein product [Caenorhabditis auriculariae]